VTFASAGTWRNAGTSALSMSNVGIGNLLIVEVINYTNKTVQCTALTGGGATWTQAGTTFNGTTNSESASIFLGRVTATGAQTATPTWSGTAPSGYEICGHEFTSSAGSWVFDKQGNLDSGGTANWVSLTPSFGAGELYFGFAGVAGNASAGSTAGYTYTATAGPGSDAAAFNPACGTGATFPVWADGTEMFGIMVLVSESATAGGTAVLASAAGTAQLSGSSPHTTLAGPAYAGTATDLGGGQGAWATTSFAVGGP
jgi:hypothetical protein